MGLHPVWKPLPPPALELLPNPGHPNPQAETGVLLVHGYTGTPGEMTSLAPPLVAAGMAVLAPALPGHASRPQALRGVTWYDWAAVVHDAYASLRQRHKRVVAVGLSLGAILVRTLLTTSEPPDRAVLLGIPARVRDRLGRWLLPLLRPTPLKRYINWSKDGPSDIADPAERARTMAYTWTPLEGLCELDDLLRTLRRRSAPTPVDTLMIHGRHDCTAPLSDAVAVRRALGARARLLVLPHSRHVLPRDVERDAMAATIAAFAAGAAWDALPLGPDWVWYSDD